MGKNLANAISCIIVNMLGMTRHKQQNMFLTSKLISMRPQLEMMTERLLKVVT